MVDRIKVGRFLRSLRKEKGKTQEEIAEIFGVSSRSVSRWENGNTMPDLVLLVELADYYNVDIREIIDGERKAEKSENEPKENLLRFADYAEGEKRKAVNKKKAIIFVCCGVIAMLVLMFVSVMCLVRSVAENASIFYSYDGNGNGFVTCVNETANSCFVGQYECTEYTEGMEITVPDEYDGKPVTKLGGYYGRGVDAPFFVSVYRVYMNAPAGDRYQHIFLGDLSAFQIDVPYRVEELVFVLNIGENVKTVENVEMDRYYPHVNDNGSITFYHPVVSVNCAKENKWFYSENGRLYEKKTGELVLGFAYAE